MPVLASLVVSPTLPGPALLGAAAFLLGALSKSSGDGQANKNGPSILSWFGLKQDETIQALPAVYKNIKVYIKSKLFTAASPGLLSTDVR